MVDGRFRLDPQSLLELIRYRECQGLQQHRSYYPEQQWSSSALHLLQFDCSYNTAVSCIQLVMYHNNLQCLWLYREYDVDALRQWLPLSMHKVCKNPDKARHVAFVTDGCAASSCTAFTSLLVVMQRDPFLRSPFTLLTPQSVRVNCCRPVGLINCLRPMSVSCLQLQTSSCCRLVTCARMPAGVCSAVTETTRCHLER